MNRIDRALLVVVGIVTAGVAEPSSATQIENRGAAEPTAQARDTSQAAQASAARQSAPSPTQNLRVGDVLIEGKLYSPQALFILSRPEERFGRDVVVPQVLRLQRTPTLLPYRLRPDVLATHLETHSPEAHPVVDNGAADPPAPQDLQGGRP